MKQILGYGCRVVAAAAFRRLCVETLPVICRISRLRTAAFRRLCVETDTLCLELGCCIQPPSGGCVLKQIVWRIAKFGIAAAFRRLCVETLCMVGGSSFRQPAAFRRLCVETTARRCCSFGGRSAAFRRLCVETIGAYPEISLAEQPPSGGCVLKLKARIAEWEEKRSRLQAAVC